MDSLRKSFVNELVVTTLLADIRKIASEVEVKIAELNIQNLQGEFTESLVGVLSGAAIIQDCVQQQMFDLIELIRSENFDHRTCAGQLFLLRLEIKKVLDILNQI